MTEINWSKTLEKLILLFRKCNKEEIDENIALKDSHPGFFVMNRQDYVQELIKEEHLLEEVPVDTNLTPAEMFKTFETTERFYKLLAFVLTKNMKEKQYTLLERLRTCFIKGNEFNWHCVEAAVRTVCNEKSEYANNRKSIKALNIVDKNYVVFN